MELFNPPLHLGLASYKWLLPPSMEMAFWLAHQNLLLEGVRAKAPVQRVSVAWAQPPIPESQVQRSREGKMGDLFSLWWHWEEQKSSDLTSFFNMLTAVETWKGKRHESGVSRLAWSGCGLAVVWLWSGCGLAMVWLVTTSSHYCRVSCAGFCQHQEVCFCWPGSSGHLSQDSSIRPVVSGFQGNWRGERFKRTQKKKKVTRWNQKQNGVRSVTGSPSNSMKHKLVLWKKKKSLKLSSHE